MAYSYNKETWKTSDDFTEKTANKWEQGIADAIDGVNEVNNDLDTLDTMPLLKAGDLEVGHWWGYGTSNSYIRAKNKLQQGEYIFFNNGNYGGLMLMDYTINEITPLDGIEIGESKKITVTSDTRLYFGDGSTTYTSDDFEKAVKSINYYKVGVVAETVNKVNASLEEQGLVNRCDNVFSIGDREGDTTVNYCHTKNNVSVKEGDIVTVKYRNNVIESIGIGYKYSDGSMEVDWGGYVGLSERKVTIPSGVVGVFIAENFVGASATNYHAVSIYVNNEIDEVKAALPIQIVSSYQDEIKVYRMGNIVQVDIDGDIGTNQDRRTIASSLPVPVNNVYVNDLIGQTIEIIGQDIIVQARSTGWCNAHIIYFTR